MSTVATPHAVVIGCGALGRELVAIAGRLPGLEVRCLPALLHNRPDRIAEAVRAAIRDARLDHGPRVPLFVTYADCGTGGALDRVLAEEGVERLAGAHCYEVYAGAAAFAALSEREPGTFYLTDFLARQFDTLVWSGLGLDRHPELLPVLFGNYRRLVYLAQTEDPDLTVRAEQAAGRLGVEFERRATGLGDLEPAIRAFRAGATARPGPGHSAAAA